jgi:hypothetical protein
VTPNVTFRVAIGERPTTGAALVNVEVGMRLLNSMQNSMQQLSRKVMLSWQAKVVEKAIRELPAAKRREAAALTLAELEAAGNMSGTSLHGSTSPSRGPSAQQAFERVRSRLQPIRLRGLATWIAVVYHETRDSADEGFQGVHRDVLGLIAELKASMPAQKAAA